MGEHDSGLREVQSAEEHAVSPTDAHSGRVRAKQGAVRAKARTPKSDSQDDIELQAGDMVQRRDVIRITEYYKLNIRPHSRQEELGSWNSLKRLFEAGITPQQVWTAMKHYEANPLRLKANSVEYIKTMRSFFRVDNITAWQEPRKMPAFAMDPAIELLTRLDATEPSPIAKPVTVKPTIDDTDSSFFEI